MSYCSPQSDHAEGLAATAKCHALRKGCHGACLSVLAVSRMLQSLMIFIPTGRQAQGTSGHLAMPVSPSWPEQTSCPSGTHIR